jgi:lipoyl(octanoyl) transferase
MRKGPARGVSGGVAMTMHDAFDVRLWCDGSHDAPHNMAVDAAALERMAAGGRGTRIRLFGFAPAGVTLGRAQDPARELDLTRLEAEGIPWATRPTGGRAIWHDEEWTFSLVTVLGPKGWALTPSQAYERTGRLLAAAMQHLGVPVVMAPGSPRGVGSPRAREGAAPPCFASTARHELVLEGRKFAGIAQRSVRGALLQQGSLLLGTSHARLADYAAVPTSARESLRARILSEATPAGPWLGSDLRLERFAEALVSVLPSVERVRDLASGSA